MKILRNLFTAGDAHKLPPEAFAYDDDITKEAVDLLRAKADAAMKEGTWKVIEGDKLAK